MGSQYQWIMPEGAQAASLRERILQRRGLTGEREQALFASSLPSLSLLREPASLPGADAAAAALDDWLKQGLRIAIYGDYDADGLCAAAIMSARGTPSSKAAMAVVKAAGSCIKTVQKRGFPGRLDPLPHRA